MTWIQILHKVHCCGGLKKNNKKLDIIFCLNMLGTESESFPTMHDTYCPEYKRFEKYKEILKIFIDFV